MRLRSFLAVSALAATALVPLAAAQGAEQSPPALRLKPATTSADVQRILATDETAHAGPDGHLYYVDPAPVGAPRLRTTASSTTAESSTDDHTTSEAAVPTLHSRPGSTHTIYLDFGSGSLAADNRWVTKTAPKMSSGSYNGFSLDGNYADYTATEVTFITKVWKIVAEKFAPWDIDVTTQNPGVDAYTRSSEADTEYGTHVVITTETGTGSPHQEICNQNCAGIAWNEVFSEPYNTG